MSHYHGEREKDLYDRKRKEQEKKDSCNKDKRIKELEAQLIEAKKDRQSMAIYF